MLIAVVFTSGCASIFCGTKQRMAIKSAPEGATVVIVEYPSLQGGQTNTTPARVVLKRTRTYEIRVFKEGYQEKVLRLSQGANPWMWGNVAVGGMIGACAMLIDMSTGASHTLRPTEVNVTLNEVPREAVSPSAEPQPPRNKEEAH